MEITFNLKNPGEPWDGTGTVSFARWNVLVPHIAACIGIQPYEELTAFTVTPDGIKCRIEFKPPKDKDQ